MNRVISISAIGLPEKERTVLSVTVRLLSAFDTSVKVLDAGVNDGDIAIIDPASEDGRQYLASPSANQHRVLISDNSSIPGGHRYLARPVLVQTLRDTLVEAIENVGSIVEAAPEPVRESKSSAAPVSTPRPATAVNDTAPSSLLNACNRAVMGKLLLEVKAEGMPAFYIHGPSRYIYSQAKESDIEALAATKQAVTGTRLVEQDFVKATSNIKGRPLAEVYWPIMLYGGEGQDLPVELQQQAVQLKAWPRIKPAHARNEHLLVLLQLTKRAMTAEMAAKSADVSQGLANDLFHAIHVLQVGEVSASQSAPAAEVQATKSKGLFGKIMQHLAKKRA